MINALKGLARSARTRLRLRGARARNRQKAGADGAVRWGILGTGAIAGLFADGLSHVPGAHLAAVGSREAASARRFARLVGAPRAHASYAALAADPDIDVIYVATLNARHHDDVRLCLRHGKHVLCEKPFATNVAEAEAMVADARARGLFLMEAMWTRFLPSIAALREALHTPQAGTATRFTASFGFQAPVDPGNRLYDPAKGGGALLDVGVYTITLAVAAFGAPERVEASLKMASSGVDESGSATLHFPRGRRAELLFSIVEPLANDAEFTTDTGRVRLEPPFWSGSRVIVEWDGQPRQVIDCPAGPSGYTHEAAAVTDAIRQGRREDSRMPLDESVIVMRVVDEIRAAAR